MHVLFAALLALTQPWLLVSDLHVNPFDPSTTPSTYHSDTDWALFDSTVAAMRRAAPDARVVVISGDFLAHKWAAKASHATPKRAAQPAAVQTMTRIERTFAKAFPHAQFLIAMGNNDDPCGDYTTAPETAYLKAVARIWAPLVDRGGASPQFAASFVRGGDYVARLPGGLRAVVLDDVYWSFVFRPCGRAGITAPAAQMRRFAAHLRQTRAGQRSVVLMHIPPGVDPSSTLLTHRFVVVPFLAPGPNGQLLSLLHAHAKSIAFAIAGHMHRQDFRLGGGVPLLLAPAISPVYENNPGFARLDVATGGVIQDYTLYAYNEDAGSWSQTFDFDKAYGASRVDAASLAALHARLGNDENLRDRWANAMVGDAQVAGRIEGSWRAYWCAQTELLPAKYASCAGDQRRAALLPILLAGAAVLVLIGIVFGVMRLARQRRSR